MSFFELLQQRYSVRQFATTPIETEKLSQILEAGRIAPTACNIQPQRIQVITDASALLQVDECTPCRYNAPVVLLICYDKNVCWQRKFDGATSGDVDTAIATTYMMLGAQSLGLGSCWVMHFDPAKTTQLFNLPEHLVPVAFLPMGYPAENATPAKQHTERFPVAHMLL